MTETPVAKRLVSDRVAVAVLLTATAVVVTLLVVALVTDGQMLWLAQWIDLPAAVLVLVSLLIGMLLPMPAIVRRTLAHLSEPRHIYLFAAFVAFAVLAVGTVVVLGVTPISADEEAPLFQARLFAEFRIIAQYPAGMLDAVIPRVDQQVFIVVSPDGRAMSAYFPGWALLMTPFVWLGVPWLLGPAMGATAVYMIGRLAELLTNSKAAVIALILTLASGSFLLTGMSLYPAGGFLTLSLVYAWFLIRGGTRDYFLAGLVGGLALNLNNPIPHAVFALPWLLWLLLDPARRRRIVPLTIGYLPGLIVMVAWVFMQSSLATPEIASTGGLWTSKLPLLAAFPSIHSIGLRFLDLLTAWSWSSPGLLVLAAVGWWQTRDNIALRLLGASFASTVLLYTFYPTDQGLGYGARYFNVAWGVLPILAAAALWSPERYPLRRFVLTAALAGLILVVPLQLLVGHTQDDRRTAPMQALSGPGVDLYFVDFTEGGVAETVLANDLSHGTEIVLVSQGPAIDQSIVDRWFPGARLVTHNLHGSGYARP
jgi:hypothetical protein